MRRLLLLPAVLGLALTSCGHTSSQVASGHTSSHVVSGCCPPPAQAHVTGALVGVGGPPGAGPQHWSGKIHVKGRAYTTVQTDATGHFSLDLPAGVYRFTGTSPQYNGGRGTCAALRPVTALAHQTTRVKVVCQLR